MVRSKYMNPASDQDRELQAIRNLYPGLTDAELLEAAETLDQYARLLLRIAERIDAERKEAT